MQNLELNRQRPYWTCFPWLLCIQASPQTIISCFYDCCQTHQYSTSTFTPLLEESKASPAVGCPAKTPDFPECLAALQSPHSVSEAQHLLISGTAVSVQPQCPKRGTCKVHKNSKEHAGTPVTHPVLENRTQLNKHLSFPGGLPLTHCMA